MYKAESFDFGVIFNISPICVASFFEIYENKKNKITSELLKIIYKICSKGERKINEQYRLFSMCYSKEFNCIYDFIKIILILNDYLNDLYDNAKNDLISEKKKNNVVKDFSLFINFVFNKVNDYLKNDINEKQIINEVYNRFKKDDFINRFQNVFKNKYNNEKNLEFIDGNECVKIINNINEKIYSVKGNIFDFFDSKIISNFFLSKKPLTDTIKIALYNYEKQDTEDIKKIFFIISDGESEELEEEDLEYFQKISLEKKIHIFSIYLNPNIKYEGKFYDKYETERKEVLNLFKVSTWIRYSDPLINFFILNGWEFPISGEGKLFVEVNSTQNLYIFIELLNKFCFEINNNHSIQSNDSFINGVGMATINRNVYQKIISQFEAKDQGKNNATCYANAISAGILITLSRFSDNFIIDEEEYIKLRDEIIEFTKKKNKT